MKDDTEAVDLEVDENSPLPQSDQIEVNKNDFIIRDGFPVLYLPTGKPNIDDTEPLPRHLFWSAEDALTVPINVWDSLRQDSAMVFTARTRDSQNEAYSAGITYFLPSQMKPRCALEYLVQSIFQLHTKDLDPKVFIPEQSGAEWWTLVLNDSESSDPIEAEEDEDEDDDVGLHFDADYGLEAQVPNLLLHPRIASVTYLSDYGSPTIVFSKSSPSSQPNVQHRCPTRSLNGPITQAWLSHPKLGKHIAFDGRLLHGAPSTFFPAIKGKVNGALASNDLNDCAGEPPLKKQKSISTGDVLQETTSPILPQQHQRITLLVNIWLNHCPMDAEPLEENLIQNFTTPWNANAEAPLCSWSPNVHLDVAPPCPTVTLKAAVEPAGIDEIVLCNRYVAVTYGASMDDFHNASTALPASNVELRFEPNALKIEVGKEVSSDDEGDATENAEDEDDADE